MRLTIDKHENAIYLQNYQLYLDVEYNVNELILMTHISTAQQVELKTLSIELLDPTVQKANNEDLITKIPQLRKFLIIKMIK